MPMQPMFQGTPLPPRGGLRPMTGPPTMGGPPGGGPQFTSGGPLMPPGQQLPPQLQQILAQMQQMQMQPQGNVVSNYGPPQTNTLSMPPGGPGMPGVGLQPQPGIQPMPPFVRPPDGYDMGSAPPILHGWRGGLGFNSMPGVSVQPRPGIVASTDINPATGRPYWDERMQPGGGGLTRFPGPPTMGPGQGGGGGRVSILPAPTPQPPMGRWRGPNKIRPTSALPSLPSGLPPLPSGLSGMGGLEAIEPANPVQAPAPRRPPFRGRPGGGFGR